MEAMNSDVKDKLTAHQVSIDVQVHFTPAPDVFLQVTNAMVIETAMMVAMNETAHRLPLVTIATVLVSIMVHMSVQRGVMVILSVLISQMRNTAPQVNMIIYASLLLLLYVWH